MVCNSLSLCAWHSPLIFKAPSSMPPSLVLCEAFPQVGSLALVIGPLSARTQLWDSNVMLSSCGTLVTLTPLCLSFLICK